MATILDIFCKPSIAEQRMELMKNMVFRGDSKGNISLWERLLDVRFENYMPKFVSRLIEYAIYGPKTEMNMIALHYYYFVMLGHEPLCQRIVINELLEAGDEARAEFFRNVFILEIQLYFDILFLFPFTSETIVMAIKVLMVKLKVSWNTQSPHNFIITRDEERILTERDRENLIRIRDERNKKKKVPGMAHIRKKSEPKPKKQLKPKKPKKSKRPATSASTSSASAKKERVKKERRDTPFQAQPRKPSASEERAIEEGIIAKPRTTLGVEELMLLKALRKADAINARKNAEN